MPTKSVNEMSLTELDSILRADENTRKSATPGRYNPSPTRQAAQTTGAPRAARSRMDEASAAVGPILGELHRRVSQDCDPDWTPAQSLAWAANPENHEYVAGAYPDLLTRMSEKRAEMEFLGAVPGLRARAQKVAEQALRGLPVHHRDLLAAADARNEFEELTANAMLNASSAEEGEQAVIRAARGFARQHFPGSFVDAHAASQRSPDIHEQLRGERAFSEILREEAEAHRRPIAPGSDSFLEDGRSLADLSIAELEQLMGGKGPKVEGGSGTMSVSPVPPE